MTRRERLERKLELRRDWAESRHARAAVDFKRADLSEEATGIPLGQPILVGHHSERRHRRVIERADAAMHRSFESADMARHHEAKADGIETALETSIFSDDTDAVEALTARITEREAEALRIIAYNKSARKAAKAGEKHGDLSLLSEDQKVNLLRTLEACPYHIKPGAPMPSYVLSNLRGRINADKKRLAEIVRRATVTEKAEASESGFVVTGQEYISVTFAEKPDADTLQSLRDAGFHWSGGSWHGVRANLPASLVVPA